jgi:putative peptide zinc metalloprotease protein
MERPTFSPFWHRVRAMTPRLRSHVQVTRQFYRGQRWLVAHDPTSNNFYRLTPVAYELVSMLDGRRTVDEAWQISLSKHADNAPTQPEVIELIGQLYSSNLLAVDASPETEQLLARGRQRVQKRIAQQALSVMYFKLPLLNPDRLLTTLEPIFRPVLSRWALALWLVFVGYVLARLVPAWDQLIAEFSTLGNPGAWGWMLAVFVLLKLWHELGHGLICKRFGGQVPQMGVMLLVLLPSPYVDASSAWGFANRWKRIAVGAGGMLFELFAASVAGLVWLATSPGELAHQVSYYILFSASVATVAFNANPLMKFDGYYMLSDWLEVPNLQARSQQLIHGLLQKHLLRLKNVRPVTNLPGEWWLLLIYGILAGLYRVLIFFSITMWLLGQWFGLGLVLAVWSAAAWFLVPTGKLISWLASGPQLAEHRARSIAITGATVCAIALLVGVLPLPDWRRATGVVEALSQAGVFAKADGVVQQVHARAGQRVTAGQPVLTLMSPELDARIDLARAELAELEVQARASRAEGEPAALRVVHEKIDVARRTLADLQQQSRETVVVAPRTGTLVGLDPALLVGRHVAKGEQVGEVLNLAPGEPAVRVRAVVEQRDADWLFALTREQSTQAMRLASRLAEALPARITDVVPAGQRVLPHASLGTLGGGDIEVDPQDGTGRTPMGPRFDVLLQPDDPRALDCALPGQRVYVRFALPGRSLARQVWDRFAKAVQGRVNL